MKYKLGDFVRFVDEKMEGFVTRIIDEQMIGVTGADNFEIPVLASKVTTIHGYQPTGAVQKNTDDAPQALNGDFKTKGVYLAVISDLKANTVVHFHLVNDTSFQLLTSLTTEKQNHFKGEYSNIILPGSAAKIYSAQLADLQLWPKFIIRILFHTSYNTEPPAPLLINEKFKAKDFSGTKKRVPVTGEQGWLIQLDEPEPLIDPQKLKESFFKTTEEKIDLEKPEKEIDLHIEKLRNDYRFINDNEILAIQLTCFNKKLDAAIVHQLSEIVFIHGLGNGILKHEIHKLLSKNQRIQTFMDARKDKFGYGATKVLLK